MPDPRAPQRLRHPLRFRRLEVLRRAQITPHLIRITLTGEELQGFFSPGFDDHAKLLFPDPATGQLQLPTVSSDGKPLWGDGPRPAARDYTPRSYDAQAGELVFDFALHQAGPATAWAERARPGNIIGVGGPRGSFVLPVDFDGHILIGDDTALPAIWRRLQELPAQTRVLVLAEVDSPQDEVALPTRAQADIRWVYRQDRPLAAPGAGLLQALQQVDLPSGDVFAWIACESGAAKALRAYLVTQRSWPARRVRASGYWRLGSAAIHETVE